MFGNLFAPVRQFFARLFCRHLHLKFIEEIQGARAQAMSIWQTPFKHECLDCGVAVFRSEKVEADNG